ncbi:MAG: HDOD domain-containing protein [Chloroflexi bacterium]|nr:HDOD domain-containing protein [Chloroflexota bacterium]MDA1148269.1 HDOD domain-containing protein [Chloroflexota bacterium]
MTINAARVPVLSPAHSQSVSLIMSKQATITEIAAVVEVDPAITLALLRFANSAADAPAQRIVRASDAIVRLGLEETQRVILGIVMQQSTGADLTKSGLDQDELWRHLVGTALLADAIASTDESVRAIRPLAFSAGLLHDVGRLALACSSPPHYQRVLRRIKAGATDIEAERAEFDTDHQTLGIEVASIWGLPDALIPAIGEHHDATEGIGAVVRRARQLTVKLGIGDGVSPRGPRTLTEADDDAIAVMHAGGPAQLEARINWFSGGLPR